MSPFVRKLLIVVAVVVVVLAGFAWWATRGNPADHSIAELSGPEPVLAEPEPERIPSVAIAEPIGWEGNEAPAPAPGLSVNRFAEGLDHPRTMLTLPNGDVLVTLTNSPPRPGGGITGWIMGLLMDRAGAAAPSANRIVLLRDGDGDGRAEQRFNLRQQGLSSPSGLAFGADTLYVANHDAVLAFPFTPGATSLTGQPRKLMDLPPAGNHWMRNLLLSPAGDKLYVAVGSASNIAEGGMEAEQGRAGIWEIDLATGSRRQFAAGLRNPNGMDWNPSSGEMWTVVNERDMLGPDLVPDYLTNVPVGAQYGWPWVYWKEIVDERVEAPMPQFLTEYARKPEYALGAHTAPLGLVFAGEGNRLGSAIANGAIVARHGSWNRKPLAGYDVVFVPFDGNGNPQGLPQQVLSGFLTGDGRTRGRPTWVAFDRTGALLVSDDTAGIVWRVEAQGAAPNAAVRPVVTERMPANKSLSGNASASFRSEDEPQ